MDIAIAPTLVAAPSQGGTTPALKPGDVVTAKVLQILADGMARLSLANMIFDVPSEVALTPGSTIQLAVGGTAGQLKLALIDPPAGAANGQAVAAPASSQPVAPSQPAAARLAPEPPAALSAALRSAAVRQGGLAPLFADLAAAAGTNALPAPVREAAARLLAFQVPASTISAADVKQAFARSGVFMEAQLAAAAEQGGAAPPPSGDLKAALLVLRHVLKTWVDGTPATPPQCQASPAPQPGQPAQPGQPGQPVQAGQPAAPGAAKPTVLPSGSSQPGVVPAPPPTEAPTAASTGGRAAAPAALPGETPDLPVAEGRILRSLLLPGTPAPTLRPSGLPALPLPDTGLQAEPPKGPGSAATTPTAEKPVPAGGPNPPPPAAPPYRGGPLAAQPAAAPSIVPEADPLVAGERLLEETDAAISRQTLLQSASLPESGSRARDPQIRWNFEIPLATPQGTAVAQFEIARDGGGGQATRAEPVWRVRFTLDVEPIGPVHAQIALAGGKTSVALWAERPASAVRLRHDASQLSAALREAALEPGDVLVRLGEPPRPPEQPAGRFVDRAS
jgi:Flagellar hook-length control protein FliK